MCKFWVSFCFCKNLIFQNFSNTLCLLKYYLWCKFQQDRTIFGGVRAQRPLPPSSTKSHFMDAALPEKHLKIYNLTTTNAILMKLTTIMYLHETFHSAKNWGVSHRVWEGVNRKSLKKSQKISFLA